MVSPTQWKWVWVNSGSWWWTGRPGMLQSMVSQIVGHLWVTELNWIGILVLLFLSTKPTKFKQYGAWERIYGLQLIFLIFMSAQNGISIYNVFCFLVCFLQVLYVCKTENNNVFHRQHFFHSQKLIKRYHNFKKHRFFCLFVCLFVCLFCNLSYSSKLCVVFLAYVIHMYVYTYVCKHIKFFALKHGQLPLIFCKTWWVLNYSKLLRTAI